MGGKVVADKCMGVVKSCGSIDATSTKLIDYSLWKVVSVCDTGASPQRHINPTTTNGTTTDCRCDGALLTVVAGAFLIDTTAKECLTMSSVDSLNENSSLIPINDTSSACPIDSKRARLVPEGVSLGEIDWWGCLVSRSRSSLPGQTKEVFCFTDLTI